MVRTEPRLRVIDTHAGAGLYDLGEDAARRSGEAQAGVARLMTQSEPPAVLRSLAAAVKACNPGGGLRRYPGSPLLAAGRLGLGQAYTGYELRPDDHAVLQALLARQPRGPDLKALRADGYEGAARELASSPATTLLLVDPPFERADDYARIVDLIAARPRPERQGALIWTPLKDLETFDAFLGGLEATRPNSLQAVQVRLRPLADPMKMNGCAVVLVDAPDLTREAKEAAAWISGTLGERGGGFRVERLAGAAT
jgi:23S rRNA (adenine2030-N6)-methyltransferase